MYELEHDLFFKFIKMNVKNKKWANLPSASKTVHPVICCHWNPKLGYAYPSQETIAKLAGCDRGTVGIGVQGLIGYPGFNLKYFTTGRGRRKQRYYLNFDSEETAVPFYHSIIREGYWAKMNPSTKAAYPVIRCWAFFDFHVYADENGVDITPDTTREIYAERVYDYLIADIATLSEYAGISEESMKKAILQLIELGLIEMLDFDIEDEQEYPTLKVYLQPKANL